MNDLTISLVQSNLHWENVEANLKQFDQQLSSLKGKTDLIILPEMFTTGFSMNPEKLAENMKGQTVSWMKNKASELGAAICGSLIIEENSRYFNRLIFMHPEGHFFTYDKRHLFTLGKENEHYTPGINRLVVSLKGWKIMPLICYDLRFPVWSRNDRAYDLLVYVANWPEPRRNAWKSLLIGRAIENQAYTVGVNRVGKDGTGANYTGDSCLIDYSGEVLFSASKSENIFTTTISKSDQQSFRSKLEFLADRDNFEIK